MKVLPPGTILQHLYLKERLKSRPPDAFIEIGVGQGVLSALLLEMGWTGTGYDLNPKSLERAAACNANAVKAGRYQLKCENWLTVIPQEPVDLIISCMVLEHLNEEQEAQYLEQCIGHLKDDGIIYLFVPASPAHWGIEDDIAGHFRRYTHASLSALLEKHGLECTNLAGLTYPLSNMLLPVSNWLVKRSEAHKKTLPVQERTEQSGNRNVAFKTTFPVLLKLCLNEIVLWPWHILQKLNANNPHSLVLFAESRKKLEKGMTEG